MTKIADKMKFNAIEKTLHILSIFSIDNPSMSLVEICAKTQFNQSTTYRILQTLTEYGYIIRTSDKNYCIGTQPVYLSAVYEHEHHLTQIRPIVDNIRDICNETASFQIEEDNSRICIYRAHSNDRIRHHIEQGTRLELNRGASGRIILAYGQRKNDNSGFFYEIRKKGFHVAINEHNASLFAVAIPVISSNHQFVGALCISGPIDRWNDTQKDKLLNLLYEQRDNIDIV
jgi:DNA-binding IclR family transcriptional regulator